MMMPTNSRENNYAPRKLVPNFRFGVRACAHVCESKDVRHSDHACPRIATGLLNGSRVTVGVGCGVVYLRT